MTNSTADVQEAVGRQPPNTSSVRDGDLAIAVIEPLPTADERLLCTHLEEVESPDDDAEPRYEQVSLARRIATLAAVLIPPLGLIGAIVLLWGVALSWIHLVLLVVGYFLTAVGVTVGYHRLFTHKSFEAHPAVKWTLGVLGSMAIQGPILGWVATHRMHHQHSDTADDPHSPHVRAHHDGSPLERRGAWGRVRGFMHAHIGWFFTPDPPEDVMRRYVPDLLADPMTKRISDQFALWVAVGIVLPGLIAWAVTGSWIGGLLGILWGSAIRIFLVHHVTWSVNSVCHLWGSRPFRSHDHSRNNAVFGILALGEGWHNAHHAFPASARHGLRWWEFDAAYLLIRGLEAVGLARNVRVPDTSRVAAKRNRQTD